MNRPKLFVVLVLLSLLSTVAWAQSLKVVTRVIPPFVIQQDDKLTGFSVDLWKALTEKMGVKSSFLVKSDVVELLDAVKAHNADVGIAAISISAERDKDFDFSQPMFDSGLQIVTKNQESGSSVVRLWNQILGSGIFTWLLVIFTIGLVPAHLVWLVEHKCKDGILKHSRYFPGILEAYWWSLACLATQAEEMPKSALGRIVAVFWMFTAVVFIAFFTAQVTASLTVQQLQGAIQGPDDLPGKKVATTTGSTSSTYLHEHKATVVEFPQIDQAYEALEKGDADAVVFDAPVLKYFVAHGGKGRFRTVGDVFQKEYYGIIFMPNSPYRKPIERALLSMKEDGSYQDLYDKWFSSK